MIGAEDIRQGDLPFLGLRGFERTGKDARDLTEPIRKSIWEMLRPFSAPFRAPEERGELQGGQSRSLSSTQETSSPSNLALDKRLGELRTEYPQAVSVLQNSKEPPQFEDLPWMYRVKLKSEAAALGVEPQEVIDRAHQLANPKKAQVSPAAEVPDDPVATEQNNSFLDILGHAEGTDQGDVYNETLGYGAFTGGDVDLVNMTLDEVDEIQGQILRHPSNTHNASPVGRYQIVRKTMRKLRRDMGLKGDELFTPELQDRMAMELMRQRGLEKWRNGEITDKQFLTNLSKEWASLPLPGGTRSAYGGRTRVSSKQVLDALLAMSDDNPGILRQIMLPGGTDNLNLTQKFELLEKLYG